MLVTAQVIADSAIDLADMKFSQFIDQTGGVNTELIRYLRIAYKDLYNQMILSKEDYFVKAASPVTLVVGTDTYDLPADFYKLNGVDLTLDAASGRFLTLRPMMFAERNKYRSGLAVPLTQFGYRYQYTLIGYNKIRFTPQPNYVTSYVVWYTPEPAIVTTLADILQVPSGGDEYMSLYVAELMLAKEESDPSNLNAKRMEVLQQLKNTLRERDAGAPNYITDETSLNIGAYFPYGEFE